MSVGCALTCRATCRCQDSWSGPPQRRQGPCCSRGELAQRWHGSLAEELQIRDTLLSPHWHGAHTWQQQLSLTVGKA